MNKTDSQGMENRCKRLRCLIHNTTSVDLKKFMVSVLSNPEIRASFFRLPASSQHHHSYRGGLIDHSLECSELIQNMTTLETCQRELGMIAALFHDIGKIRLLTRDGNITAAGYVLQHDTLTLEILAPHLRHLDRHWPDGAIALRYIWTHGHHASKSSPWMSVYEAVWAADRISAGVDAERRAFKGLPSWRNSAILDVPGPKRRHWRPSPKAIL